MPRKTTVRAVKKIKEESEEFQKEVRKRTVTYVAAALGLVTGLAWNEAIKAVIEYLFPLDQNTMAAKIIYAAIMTVILVFATAYILREPKEEEK
ncbi:MAG: hypothetical protein HYW00_01240 [Candidatus Colwellbacteria bacterium]|nr:hypothetical protein [Candidatus Colwellbacteria bacterium]